MLSSEEKNLMVSMPKADTDARFTGVIPWALALKLAKRNHGRLPYDTPEDMRAWAERSGYIGGEENNLQLLAPVCRTEQDYFDILLACGRASHNRNIIYREIHIEPIRESARYGLPLDAILAGCRAGRNATAKKYGVELVFIAAFAAPEPEALMGALLCLEKHRDLVEGIGLWGCSESCEAYKKSFALAKDMGFYRCFNAQSVNRFGVWNAIETLDIDRLEDPLGCETDEELLQYLADKGVACTFSLSSGQGRAVAAPHPMQSFLAKGVPCVITSRMPELGADLLQGYASALDKLGIGQQTLATLARNAFYYSIHGQRHLPEFETWAGESLL